jgi:hypothetical protein
MILAARKKLAITISNIKQLDKHMGGRITK